MFSIEAEPKALGLLEGEKDRERSISVGERQCSSRLKDAFLVPCGPHMWALWGGKRMYRVNHSRKEEGG